jgi:hypothetical protein
MMRFDHKYHYDLTPEKVDALVAEQRNPLPTRGEVARSAGGDEPTRKPRAPRKKKADA